MTALTEYQRLESPALWRASDEDQRRDVVISVGDATLMIYDMADRPLAHWSLAAVIRRNAGGHPALYAPGADALEELEVDDELMIDAIEKVRKTIERRRPHQGRLRFFLLGGGLAVVLALGTFWLPDALVHHAAGVVPTAQRSDLGLRLLSNIRSVAGRPCNTTTGRIALDRLYKRLLADRPGRLVVLAEGIAKTAHLPGGLILINRSLVEDHEAPDVVAGYILAEALRADSDDPVETLLEATGPITAIRLLTTGDIPEETLADYAAQLVLDRPADRDNALLLDRFRAAQVASTPYAYARDSTGETTLDLIEADPGGAAPVLPDSDWVSLQGICGE